MPGWTDRRLLDLTGAAVPIVQAPMAGAGGVQLAAAAMRGGALGSLPCALLDPATAEKQVAELRGLASGPVNLNFFCHSMDEAVDESAWRALLAPFYAAEGVSPPDKPAPLRRPFDDALCAMVEKVRPEVVSFHFGLPALELLDRVRAAGAKVFGNATTVEEARWLAERGIDAVIAQAYEAGGHAGWFLDRHRPVGLMALVRGIVEAVDLPVIAAGGIADARSIAAALTLGASGVQLGTAYLATPESLIGPSHRALLGTDVETGFTNLITGRMARGYANRLTETLGWVRDEAPAFPHAATAIAPLRAHAEAEGRSDYATRWAGQGAALVRPEAAQALTERLARETLALLDGKDA